MGELRIYTLGGFQVNCEEKPVTGFDTDKTRALLAYLAVEADRPHQRLHLAALLWPDQPEERAMHSLRQALSGLRKTLGRRARSDTPSDLVDADSPHLIQAYQNNIQIDPEAQVWVDVCVFENLLQIAYQHYQRSSRRGRLNLRRLRQAVALYKGEFLAQLFVNGSPLFDEWMLLRRENIDQQMRAALEYLVEIYERRGEYLLARQSAESLAQLAPWDEAACCQVMRLYEAEGQWSAALAYGQKYIHYLVAELGVEPSATLQACLAGVRQRSLAQPQMPAPTLDALPLADTPFIGREQELDHLAGLLADPGPRLISLVGMGGIGKTRLALEAAGEQRGLFRDGVYFVPVSGAANLFGLVAALAESVGFTFFGERPPHEQLTGFFAGKDVLLVLDSFEHLLGDATVENENVSFLLSLLRVSASMKVIVTSRQPLRLRKESVVEVSGLEYPVETSRPSRQSGSALELFAGIARRAQPGFSLEADYPVVAAICQEVEGVPLAIELAASWVHWQSCSQIYAGLQTDIRLLETAMQDMPARHRSLRAVFEQTWRLLSAAEREAFKRLSVFQGSFGMQAAERVAGAEGPLLHSLAQKSVLHQTGPERFVLHSLLQQFGAEKLAADPPTCQETIGQHADYYADFLAARILGLKSAGQQQALVEMAQEQGNWRKAWERLVERKDASQLGRCAEAVFHFYNIRAGFLEGTQLIQQAAACLDGCLASAVVTGQVYTYLGALAYRTHADELSEASLERARQILENGSNRASLGLCLIFWAAMQARKKNPAEAMQAVERSIELYRDADDPWGLGYAFYLQGLFLNRRGELPAAATALQASLNAARACGDLHRQIGPLNLLGDSACQTGDYGRAQVYFEESMAISRRLQDRYNEALIAVNLGTVYHLRKEGSEARRLYQLSLEICQEIGDDTGQAFALSNLGELASDCGEFQHALPYFQQGLALARSRNDTWAEISCLNNLANTYLELDDLSAAGSSIRNALQSLADLDEPPLAAITLLHLGRLKLRQGQRKQAGELLGLVIHTGGVEEHIRQKALQTCAAAELPAAGMPLQSLAEILPVYLAELQG